VKAPTPVGEIQVDLWHQQLRGLLLAFLIAVSVFIATRCPRQNGHFLSPGGEEQEKGEHPLPSTFNL
jgi:hypothetical protein